MYLPHSPHAHAGQPCLGRLWGRGRLAGERLGSWASWAAPSPPPSWPPREPGLLPGPAGRGLRPQTSASGPALRQTDQREIAANPALTHVEERITIKQAKDPKRKEERELSNVQKTRSPEAAQGFLLSLGPGGPPLAPCKCPDPSPVSSSGSPPPAPTLREPLCCCLHSGALPGTQARCRLEQRHLFVKPTASGGETVSSAREPAITRRATCLHS